MAKYNISTIIFPPSQKALKPLYTNRNKLTSKPHQGSLRRRDRTILIGDLGYV